MSIENRIISSDAEKELPRYVMTLLWYMLEQREKQQKELHRFELDADTDADGRSMQKITHTLTTYNEHQYPDESPVKSSIIIKSDGSGAQIMMLADENDDCVTDKK